MSCVVVALGGNALAGRRPDVGASDEGAHPNLGVDPDRLGRAADALVDLAREHALVVTHGNGPQVGWLAVRDGDGPEGSAAPLDVMGAETEGMLGYLLERALRTRLPGRPVVSLLTQVVIDPADPAFQHPSKPIGGVVEAAEADALRAERGWSFVEVPGGWRRVVASPRPRRILELEAIDLLLSAGHVVICGGGGGIPVSMDREGRVTGVEAVIDKDRTSALLAEGVQADALLLLTDVPGVIPDWPNGTRPVDRITVSELRGLGLSDGSMGPKAEAAASFTERTGGLAAIGALEDATAVFRGEKGTRVVAS